MFQGSLGDHWGATEGNASRKTIPKSCFVLIKENYEPLWMARNSREFLTELMVLVRIFVCRALSKAGAFAEQENEAQPGVLQCQTNPNMGSTLLFSKPKPVFFPCAFTQITPEGCPLLRDTCTSLPPALHTPWKEGDGGYGWLCASQLAPTHGMFLLKNKIRFAPSPRLHGGKHRTLQRLHCQSPLSGSALLPSLFRDPCSMVSANWTRLQKK